VDDDELFDLLMTVEETVALEDKPRPFEELAGQVPPGTHGPSSLRSRACGSASVRACRAGG
jgi:hypothetical protein